MGWTLFPTSAGTPTTAAHFNELRAAIAERANAVGQWDDFIELLPAEKAPGDPIKADDFNNIRLAIVSLLAIALHAHSGHGAKWAYPVSYSDYDTHDIKVWRLDLAGWAEQNTTGIFGYVLGQESFTQAAGNPLPSRPILASAWNEPRPILRKMKLARVQGAFAAPHRSKSHFDGDSCADEITQLDDQSWSEESHQDNGSACSVQVGWSGRWYSSMSKSVSVFRLTIPGQQGGYPVTDRKVLKSYVSPRITWGRRDTTSDIRYHDLARSFSINLRHTMGANPSSFTDALTAGSSLAVFTDCAGGTRHMNAEGHLDFGNLYEYWYTRSHTLNPGDSWAVWAIVDVATAAGADLCDILRPSLTRRATEIVHASSSSQLVFHEFDWEYACD